MGEKKRKRAAEEDEADSAGRPKKSQPSVHKTAEVPAPDENVRSTEKSGLLRQEKSERRSRKLKKAANNLDKKGDTVAAVKPPKSSKLPSLTVEDALVNGSDYVPLDGLVVTSKSSKKPKKEKKASKSSMTAENADTDADAPATTSSKKVDRFICFVGNLPYNATSDQLKSHFVKIADGIRAVRLGTDKKTGRGKGYAFLEFGKFDKMRTCLKLYHHSIFDPSVKTEDKEAKPGQKETGKGRRINVELTAGGGGAGKERKEKIHAKNRKLDEERERTRLKEKEQAAQEAKKQEKKTTTGANGVVPVKEVQEDRGAIHPSRLNRVAR